ncbi:P-loop containing nucleoside triphosphate hydrolase protein [Lobosporangium transversale]|uniref:Structural maintenance of chromosomes protein 5 n=1 Tax=Lobosporangium transversale TaxID=64571 RepID=A0A1Y2GDI1_9FUNG|nr:P-loop containing nucleoside triphosphate hydrolase protein [Lobosporangium transversale]ORZ06802.1 P-loop containing nucleoside triphosphate hydrolase protein [Lobosporangium transversale]|eukprot:XP_021877723.1 P-loop containing nucleoside triphosphate hydrolase protein [Lobosporangium transversale]
MTFFLVLNALFIYFRRYQHGAIMKVSMKNFVTYESCSFSPGPNLNMIIGPNGTGKSTIVCALALGLGWNTNLLGRAKDISEFVKHGYDKGWIEIVLCNRNGSNVAIKRHINKNNNTSVWKINGENKTQKDVMKKVQSFDIQVDNLCQFLPQDRVSEFAQMTPQELLKETQRAVGGEESLQAHQKMIELWNEHKAITASMKGDLESIETNEKRNAVIEKDVMRFQQREAVLRKVRLLEIWIQYAQYGVAKEQYNQVKEERRVCFAMFKQLQAEVEPLTAKRSTMEANEKDFANQRNVLDKKYQQSVQTMRSREQAIEATEGDGEELRKDLDRLHAKVQQRQAAINSLRRKIAAQQELLDGAQSEEEINKEKDELQDKLVYRIEVLQAQQTEIIEQSKSLNARMVESRKRLDALDDIRNRRLQTLRNQDSDVFDAVLWLRDNRQLFQKHVFEPVCLEVNIKNMKHVNAIESALRNHLKTFICQTREDYNIFAREILDKRRLRVNVIAPTAKELDINNYSPPVPNNQLRHFGFDCYMLDSLDGPPALLASLCSKAGIHSIPVSESSNVDFKAIRDSKKFKRYATSTTVFTITYSRHTGEAMETATQLRPAQIFTASVDHEERARLIRDVDDIRSRLEQSEGRIRDLTAEENVLRKKHQEYVAKKEVLSNRRKDLMLVLKRNEKQRIDMGNLTNELNRKMNEPSSDQEEERIRQELRKKAKKRCSLTLEYLELAKESQQLFSKLTIATLNRLQAHAELQAVEAECTEKARQLKEMEDRYTLANREYDEVKIRAKAILDAAKEEYNKLTMEEAAEFQTLEDMLAGEQAKAALNYTPNQSIIDKYEQRQAEIKTAKDKVEVKNKKLNKIAADIEAIRGPWYAKLTETVRKISEGFSKSFEQIGCAGEVKLGEHEDYDKWCIEILVKFRDAEKLQKLTGQRQSGGERSVSTIMYLMALQSLSKVSFRVVDEINQGMDPRNERLVHSQLVEKACASGTAQYFLITPKLLPNLDYHERMKVLCIYNGEWLDEGVTKWNLFIENQLRSKARRQY